MQRKWFHVLGANSWRIKMLNLLESINDPAIPRVDSKKTIWALGRHPDRDNIKGTRTVEQLSAFPS
jgi:nuclear transport factor 2 (NTF2) superfamily protein